MWFGAGCLLVVALIIVVVLLRKGTVYFVGDSGYVAISTIEEPVHHASEAQLHKVIQRLLLGDIFDTLWISRKNDPFSGLVLDVVQAAPCLSVEFKTAGQEIELKAFRRSMKAAGYRLLRIRMDSAVASKKSSE